MQARDVMSRPVVTVRPETTVLAAATLLTERRFAAVPVVDAVGEIVGMVSEGDLIQHRFHHDPRSRLLPTAEEADHPPRTVAEVMTPTVVALGPSADAADLADALLRYDVRSIPIVEGGTVVGIVSRRDLLRTLTRDPAVVRAEVLDRLAAYTGDRQGWQVEVSADEVDLYGRVDDSAESRVLRILAGSVPGVNAVRLHRTG